MSTETCPHCGAEVCFKGSLSTIYECDSVVWLDEHDEKKRGVDCIKRKDAQKDAEIERLAQAVLDEREACAQLCERHVCTSECSDGLGSNCEFVIAQEIRARGEGE